MTDFIQRNFEQTASNVITISDTGQKAIEELILEPYRYARAQQSLLGDRIFGTFNHWFELTETQLNQLIRFLEVHFTSDLLFDDMQDNSKRRNGQPSAHTVHGLPAVLNSAHYLMFKSLYILLQEAYPPESRFEALKTFFTHMRIIDHGTGIEIHHRDHSQCPTQKQYFNVILEDKACNYVYRIPQWMRLLSKSPKRDLNFYPFCQLVGVYLQIGNDYDNLKNPVEERSKGFCEDFTEGKYSLPIIYALERYKVMGNSALERILAQRTEDLALKRYAFELIEQSGALEKAQQMLNSYGKKILKEVEKLGGNPKLEKLLSCCNV